MGSPTSYDTFANASGHRRPSYRPPHTMDPRTWLRDLTPYFMYILFTATVGPLLFGFHLAELNTPGEVITCKRKSLFGQELNASLPRCIPMNPTQLGLVSSLFTLGGFLGALAAGPISARSGRIRTMQYTTIFFTVGPIFEALAPNIGIMAFGRLVSGFGAGASIVVVPLYVSEISPPAERGFFGSFTQVMTNGGIFLTQLLGYFLSYGSMWRVVLAAAGAIGAANAIGLLFTAESPRWLATNGHARKARDNLQKIRGSKFDIEEELSDYGHVEEVEDEAQGLLRDSESVIPTSAAKTGKKESAGMLEVLRDPEHRKGVICVIVIMTAQQFTGINSIVMYGVALLADLLASNSAILNLAVSALNIAITIGCAPLADKMGRKFCLLVSICGMGISSVLLGLGIQRSISLLSAISVGFFVASFGFGLGPIPYILASELVSPEAVSSAQTWALCFNWVSTFCVAQFFPLVNEALGRGVVYYVFALLAAFYASFVLFYVPESKGKKNADEVWGRSSERLD